MRIETDKPTPPREGIPAALERGVVVMRLPPVGSPALAQAVEERNRGHKYQPAPARRWQSDDETD